MHNYNDFEEIYHKYAQKVFNYIFSKCHSKELAEDITQTTFLKAIEHADSFRNESNVITWLCKIAQNTMLDEISRRENQNIHLDDIEGSENLLQSKEDILSALICEEEKNKLYQNIHKLGEQQREIILYRLIGLTFKEIGNIFNQSETWARVNFYRAKEQLVKKMGDETV